MKYRIKKKLSKEINRGGAYWKNVSIEDDLVLTKYQTSYKYLIENFPPPLKILEAGCGLGRWLIPLTEKKYDIIGLEIEKEAVDFVKDKFSEKNVLIEHGDVTAMEFEDECFDLVLSLGVLEHFEDKDLQSRAINEHLRVLKKGGVFFVTVPYISYIRLLIHIPFLLLFNTVQWLKGKEWFFSEYRYSKNGFKKILLEHDISIRKVIWDDLSGPYNFGLTVDPPFKKWFKSNEAPYKGNKRGSKLFHFFWKLNPAIVSGGIGFICEKRV